MNEYREAMDENNDGLSLKGYAIFRNADSKEARP
jgi:hypothetical protein